VSPANQYKKFENRVTFDIIRLYRIVSGAISKACEKFVQTGKQRFTIMLIPHSEKKIFNFKMSIFSLAFVGILLLGILATFLISTTKFTGLNNLLTTKTESLSSSEASLESIRDQLTEFSEITRLFENELTRTEQNLGLQDAEGRQTEIGEGDLSTFMNLQEQDEGLTRELGELKGLSDSLIEYVDVLKEIGSVLESQRELLSDLPTYWPVAGKIRITNLWGFAVHPITGETYLHTGLDIALNRFVPILAAANGKVVTVKFDKDGLGNHVEIRHIAGLSTRYGQLE
jgi:murein DD-endopeptidase MepM/ murein hydrolase activator NlpD